MPNTRTACTRMIWLCFAIACALGMACAQTVQGTISNYHCDMLVSADSSLSVQDTIVYNTGAPVPCSGIFRYYATDYPVEFPLRHVAHITFQQVLRNGQQEQFQVSQKPHGVELQIGNEFQALTGNTVYTYTISYLVTRAIDFYPDHDEFYWHVTGGGWECPVAQASATVRFATPPDASAVQAQGNIAGDTSKPTQVSSADGVTTISSIGSLAPRQGLAFLLKFPKGLVQPPTAQEERDNIIQDNYTFFVGIAMVILILLIYVILWKSIGRAPKPGTIVAQATPPGKHSPALLRYVRTMHYDPKTLSIILVDLAVKGLLHIQELEDRYILTRKIDEGTQSLGMKFSELAKDPATTLAVEEECAANVMLGNANQFMFSSTHATQIQEANTQCKTILLHRAEHHFFLNNYGFLAIGIVLSSLCLLWLGLHEVPTEYPGEEFRLALGVIWLNLGIPFFAYLAFYYWHDIFAFAVGRIGNSGLMFKYALGVLAFLFVGVCLVWNASPMLWCVLLVLAIQHILFAKLLRRPTNPGRQLLDQIEGFRHYLHSGLLDTAPAPEHTPELFARYLPYALALDVEDQWAAQFTTILRPSAPQESDAMAWYSGPAWLTRNPVQLATSLREEMAPSMTPITVPVDG